MSAKIKFKKVYRCLPNLISSTIDVKGDGQVKIYISNVTKYTKRSLNEMAMSELIYPKFEEMTETGDEVDEAGVYQLQGNVEFIAFDGPEGVEVWANGVVQDDETIYVEPESEP